MQAGPVDPLAGWRTLAGQAAAQAPYLTAPRPGQAGLCGACRGPAGIRCVRCYQCDLHAQCAEEGLADLVVPVAYASKGGQHARNLWLYKSGGPGAGRAGAALRALLLVFLRDHGRCLCHRAGLLAPTHLAVVPSGRDRPGPHPLRALIAPCLTLPWAELTARPGAGHLIRDLDPERFTARRLPAARVLLLDDTWTSGASAQSAAVALRLAGARSVTVVVLGRHVSAGQPGRPASRGFRPELCAVHEPPALPGLPGLPGPRGPGRGT